MRRNLEFPIPLKDGWMCYLFLPKDIKQEEVDRICAMLQTLVMPEKLEVD